LRDRFGIPLRLEFYDTDELMQIVNRTARLLDMRLEEQAAEEIARRARGTPRVAGRLTRRVRDFSHANGNASMSRADVHNALTRLDVDESGLDSMDRRYLKCITENYGGGPVGVDTISAALSEQRDMIEDVIEPYLLQQGFIQRTPRGRCISAKGYLHLGLEPSKAQTAAITDSSTQDGLFE
jgi:Holliday junction DNA helicase RuvB